MEMDCIDEQDLSDKTSLFQDRTRQEVIRTRLEVIRQASFQVSGATVGIKSCAGLVN